MSEWGGTMPTPVQMQHDAFGQQLRRGPVDGVVLRACVGECPVITPQDLRVRIWHRFGTF